MVRTYLDSNASVCRRDVALVPLPQLVTIPTISVIGHLHIQGTTRIQAQNLVDAIIYRSEKI